MNAGLSLPALLLALQALAAGATPEFVGQVIAAAIAQTGQRVRYDGTYRRIPYPGGDVPPEIGVCTDVVIRAYRAVGVDLQQRVHEDMTRAFAAYPRLWGLSHPDANIDHRRVPNLQTYFRRRGVEERVTSDPQHYVAGDLVTWMLPGNLPHIGLAIEGSPQTGRDRSSSTTSETGPRWKTCSSAFRSRDITATGASEEPTIVR